MKSHELLIDTFGRIKDVVHGTVEGLTPEQLASRPNGTANSIAWLVWHLTRIQDSHIADLADIDQIWIKGGWYDKFDLPFEATDTGYGHAHHEVAAVQPRADLLLGYHDAVYSQTAAYLQQLTDEDYERIIDTNWNPPVTIAVRLISIVSDDLQHAGQAAYVRGLV